MQQIKRINHLLFNLLFPILCLCFEEYFNFKNVDFYIRDSRIFCGPWLRAANQRTIILYPIVRFYWLPAQSIIKSQAF